ncbi:MAG TPA: hypothetical protein VNC78_10710 [Actinomycetota bacterium]|nr:hypothetical protein [Actinomycetota bacterium]
MNIEATCDTCSRNFLLTQIGADSDAPGRCPFCGAHFARHYSTVLVPTVGEAEEAGARFVQSLGRLQSMETGFDIDIEGLLRTLAEEVRSHEMQKVKG